MEMKPSNYILIWSIQNAGRKKQVMNLLIYNIGDPDIQMVTASFISRKLMLCIAGILSSTGDIHSLTNQPERGSITGLKYFIVCIPILTMTPYLFMVMHVMGFRSQEGKMIL